MTFRHYDVADGEVGGMRQVVRLMSRGTLAVSAVVLLALGVLATVGVLVIGRGQATPARLSSQVTPVSPSSQVAPASSSSPVTPAVLNGVNQAQLQHCIATTHGNCAVTVPGLSQCMAKKLRCDASSNVGQATPAPRATQPAGQPSSGTVISQSKAVADALLYGANMGGHATAATKMAAKEMDIQAANRLLGQQADPSLPNDYPVWVVSVVEVVGNLYQLPGGPAKTNTQPCYTVLLNGYTGQVMEVGMGADSLNAAAK
jgi:hypothetical protein